MPNPNTMRQMTDTGGKLGARKAMRTIRARKAREQFMNAGVNRDANIIKSVRNFFNFKPTPQQKKTTSAGFSYGGKRVNTAGQYQYSGAAVRQWRESVRPVNMVEYAKMAAKADTTTDPSELNFYNQYRINQQEHDRIIEVGQKWMVDEEAYTRWVLSASTPEEQNRRIKQAQEYMESALHDVPTYDPATHSYSTQKQFSADAPLPPWISPSTYKQDLWDYYITYSHDVVQASADAYRHALDEGREQARNPYKSAFANSEQGGQVDSFLDVMIKAMDPSTINQDILGTYLNEYYINPIKTGHLKTAAGNALWNLMDTMDIASRGVRAFVAGETVLGGSGAMETTPFSDALDNMYEANWEKYGGAPTAGRLNSHGYLNDAKFKGQNVYWAELEGHKPEEVRRAQELFMRSGGYELLLKAHPNEVSRAMLGSEKYNQSVEELEAHLDAMFEHSNIDWHDIYNDIDQNYFTDKAQKDLKQGVENFKKAYTDVDAAFNADTGSMATDMVLETVLDPGLIAGGIAKTAATKGVESAAEVAVKRGFKSIAFDDDTTAYLMKNSHVRGAINQLISSNEGRNIIFRSADDFKNDADLFIEKLKNTGIFNAEDAEVFKRTVTNELMNKNISINSSIISTQKTARDILDSKSFKAAALLDKAIDGTDSAIIKSSFFVPWAGVKGAKALGSEASVVYKRVMDSDFMKKAMARIGIREKNAARTVIDKMTGEVNVTKVSDLMDEFNAGAHHEKDVRKAFQYVVDSYDDAAQEVTNITQRFLGGSVTDDEALRLVGDKISAITGGQYKSVQELAGHINDISTMRYAGDIRSAYGRIDDAFRRLQDVIDRRSENAVEGFIDEVRQLPNKEDLPRLFREHMDNSFILDLRQRVIDNAQFDITSEEIDTIIDDLRNGRWTDETVTKEQIGKGVAAQKKLAEKTLDRTITFDTFDNILQQTGINWKGAVLTETIEDGSAQFSKLEKKLGEFMTAWEKQPEVTYIIDDALKFVDRIERQIHFKEIMDIGVASEVSALAAHKLVADCNKLRKHIKRLDLINLKDVKQIVLPQLDRMALNQAFINNTDIQNAYGSFYDDVIAPIWNEFKTARTDGVDLADSSLFQDVDELAKQRYGFNRTQQLVDSVKALPGFSDDHLHSFLNTLATDFRFRDELGNIDLTPGGLRRKVEATLRAQTGQSKVGMKNMTDALQSIGSSNPSQFMKDYVEEFAEKPWLEERWNRYVNADVLDPKTYVEKQMLFTALADPSVIPEWNKLAERGQAPILFHINSTGLNNEISSMTSISFRKWVPLDVSEENPLTLERLLDAMDSEETTVFQRGMTDSDLNEFTEQVIRQLDMKDCDPSNIMKRYKEIYGVSDNVPYKTEQQMIEEACDYIRSATRTVDENGVSRSVAPTLVVHDLDGFNTNYFNNRVMALRESVSDTSATRDYINRIAKSVKDNSCNTYTRLAERSGDLYYTEDQLEQITNIIHDYIDDINHFANGYRINDMQSYSRKLHSIIKELNLKADAGELTEYEEKFLKLFNEKQGTEMLNAYDLAVKQVTSLGLYPRQYAFASTGLEDNFTKAAMEAAGRTSVNVNNRIYVDDILSYFNLETEDGFYAPIEDLKQMNSMAKYIKNTRSRQIVAGAEEFLQPHKADFDRVIQSVIDIANSNSYESIKLSYMRNMKIPDNAIDSYLMAKKLYNDHLKYWLDTDSLTSLRTNGKDLDVAKQRLRKLGYAKGFDSPRFALEQNKVYQQACDYINNNRVRFFDELTGGGFDDDINIFTVGTDRATIATNLKNSEEVLDLLQGAHEPEIYNWAARSDFEKRVVSYKDGVMKSGLDKAARYTEANSQIKSEMRQLQHIDDYFTTAGITKRQDRMTAAVYQKTNQLFDMLEQTGFLKRESFHTFMEKASEFQRLQLIQYRLNALRDSAGVFDRDRLLSELVYNGFNMSVFNVHNYMPNEMRELREFVEGLQRNGDDFLSYYEDVTTGNIFIYLNDNAVVAEADGARWINQSIRLERPVNQAVPYADFDELAEVLDLDDIEDFRGVYSHLLSCWEDTRLLSLGQINGTTGRTVTRKQAESFLQSLPSNMNDWLTSEGLLRDELTRGIIYDPGFVINDKSDMLTDFLGTLQRQAETAKDDAILINEVFHSNSNVKINDLAENFTTDELIEYFGENPEYVVCTIVADEKTATGLSVRQINMSTSAGVEAAKNTPNTTILPYSTYYEISNYMNRDMTEGTYKKLLGKYMLVYKAFALAMPGTWMRNFIDATTKAAFDNGQGVNNLFNMVQYEGKAARDIGTYGRIIASDPSLLTPANWEWVQRVYKTDMTFEDFELLRGIMDGDRYKTADRAYLSRTARQRQGFNIISGENIGLRNLDEKDINDAFNKYLATDLDLPLSKNEFLDIYLGRVQPDEAMQDAFDDMFRRLSNNMRNSNVQSGFDKVIDTMFKPFGSVEQCVRYAQSLMLRDNGFSANQITRHIHNTQFYNAPMWGTWRKLETIMPFVTFKFNNLMYWVRMMDENPRLFRYFEDTYRSVYETSIESALQEGVELDYENDYGLQSGGIPLGNGGMYLNLGNSFLSAMNDFYGLPHDFDSLNPLIRDTARASMYALGFSSNQFFSTVDLDITDDDITRKVAAAVPGYTIARKATKLFKNLRGISTEAGGPTMDAVCATLNFLGPLGIRNNYGGKNGKFDFDAYQEELAEQGKWYDANLGKIVDISQKNSSGANDPNNTFEDIQAYMLVHFGKLWDANQHKFVKSADYQEGGLNKGFDFENDPEAWTKLQQYMATRGKYWDNNQRKFVYTRQFIGGGLNAEGLEWESIVALTEEKFPGLKWDANQQAFVDEKYYIAGGMNDVRDFREVMGLRQALFGETYDSVSHKFIKTQEPTVVLMNGFMDNATRKKYDNYYSLLGIPRLDMGDKNMHVNQDGLLVTGDGKYVLTGDASYDERVFAQMKGTFYGGGRSYDGYKNYSYRKTKRSNKPYKGRTMAPTYYASAGWRSNREGFRNAFEYNYHYHSPQPAAKLNRLITPPVFYPYGGGYSKYSFQSRY